MKYTTHTHLCVTVVDTIRTIIKYLAELLWPARCVVCRQDSDFACSSCLASLQLATTPRHRYDHLNRLVVATPLTPAAETFVYALKYRGVQALAAPLADRLCDLLALRRDTTSLFGSNPLVIPVPLHASRMRERGFNQAELLAGRITTITAMQLDTMSLVRTKPTGQQAKQSGRAARYDNMKGAFSVINPAAITDRDIVLIDDVCTTGATLDDCARALSEAGARSVSAIVFAHG